MSLISFMVRALFKRGDDKRDEGRTTPEDIRRFDDIVYGPDPKWNRLDLLYSGKSCCELKALGFT